MTASLPSSPADDAAVEGRFPELTGLRAVAATAIVGTHAAFWTHSDGDTPLGRALTRLDVGVAVFFVLSGFLLSRPFLRAAARGTATPAVRPYLWRRALRVFPAYWLAVVAAMVLLPANSGATAGDWLRHLLLLPVYAGGGLAPGLGQTWSLAPEVAFYAVLPLLAAGLCRLSPRPAAAGEGWRPTGVLAGIAAMTVAAQLWLVWTWSGDSPTGVTALWLPGYLGWFGAGMALAVVGTAAPGWAPARLVRDLGAGLGTCWSAATVLFYLACGPLGGPLGLQVPSPAAAVSKNLLYLGVALLLVLPLVVDTSGVGPVRRLLACGPMTWLGEVSYGLFLFHLVVLLGLVEVLGSSPLRGSLVIVGTLTWVGGVLVAAVVHRTVERPVARWRNVAGPRRRSAVPTSAAAMPATASTPDS